MYYINTFIIKGNKGYDIYYYKRITFFFRNAVENDVVTIAIARIKCESSGSALP